jgi:Ca2+-transporting ATPase
MSYFSVSKDMHEEKYSSKKVITPVEKPWSRSWQEILQFLKVSAEKGLSANSVKSRVKRFGLNRLKEAKEKSTWVILSNQFKSLIIILLAAAAIVSFAFGEWMEGIAIAAVILINAMIGFVTELRAVRSMEALRRLGSVMTKVRRNGKIQEISAEKLVPGDIVILEGGDIVTADLRLINASKLQADESALTGESFPVSKSVDVIENEVPLAEISSMLFKGTAVTRGAAEGVVVATGMETELGKISSLVEEAEEEITPLEKRLNQLGHKLIWVTLAIAALVAMGGIVSGKEIFLMIETSIALAVAAIPEGLPIVATIALARGVWRMARRNALINRLSAVETLGATNIICTDKTGTLTENEMTVTRIVVDSNDIEVGGDQFNGKGEFFVNGKLFNLVKNKAAHEALKVGVLCNNASLERTEKGEVEAVGEPLEVALLIAGSKANVQRAQLVKKMPEVYEEAFDPDIKMMSTYHKLNGKFYVAVKGAPEAVLDVCAHVLSEKGMRELFTDEKEKWIDRNHRLADEGLRVVALASKEVDSLESKPYENLTLLALCGLMDPARREVRQAIDSCKRAGIRIIMATGDQPVTARNIAEAVGLIKGENGAVIHSSELKNPQDMSEEEKRRILQASIFARVSPKQKLDLIDIHQKNGSIVAMTGDGVNDAPALKKADIGIAMGIRGTQVAQEVADMVLKDDAFSSIVAAIEQGRIIFNNIRKFVIYLISCNVSEIMAVMLASLFNAPLPILPLQILFLNLVTDVFPALALGMGKGDSKIMYQPPRDTQESILTRSHWFAIGGLGMVITLSVLGALAIALFLLNMEKQQAVTISFLTLAFAQLWHVFNMRDSGSGLIRNNIVRNPYIWGALALCSGLLLAGIYLPGLSHVLKVMNPGFTGWMIVIGMSLIPLVIGQILKSFES